MNKEEKRKIRNKEKLYKIINQVLTRIIYIYVSKSNILEIFSLFLICVT